MPIRWSSSVTASNEPLYGAGRHSAYQPQPGYQLGAAKWLNQYGNIKIVRLAEMYLTRVETNFRNKSSIGSAPAADLNLIRARAGLPAIPAASLTLPAILKERHLELSFEGQLIHDIKRTKANVGALPFDSPKLVFPVPRREIDANGNLVHNAGY